MEDLQLWTEVRAGFFSPNTRNKNKANTDYETKTMIKTKEKLQIQIMKESQKQSKIRVIKTTKKEIPNLGVISNS